MIRRPEAFIAIAILSLAFATSSLHAADRIDINEDQVKPQEQGTSINDDLVRPSSDKDIDQDAIHAEKLSKEEVSNDAAQSRLAPPPDEGGHLNLVPYNEAKQKPPHLRKKTRDGTYIYRVKPPPQHESASFRIGEFNPTRLVGDLNALPYSELYGGGAFMFNGSYERQFFKKFGKLGWTAGAGLFTGQGNGRFVNDYNAGLTPEAKFTLIGLPLTGGLMYHFQFWDTQIFVPFVEAAADYFLLIETRDDKTQFLDAFKYGGAAAAHFIGGLQIQLDFLDKEGMWQLRQDYGISHIYFFADLRQYLGLSQVFDMTATVFEGGFLFEF